MISIGLRHSTVEVAIYIIEVVEAVTMLLVQVMTVSPYDCYETVAIRMAITCFGIYLVTAVEIEGFGNRFSLDLDLFSQVLYLRSWK
ncbi:hypothetical protein JTE90_021921 [Oedothorax gibbosus]|uniref:Uncharacterized protein n=1 Tax=Oedothorax gibbosus TaxID=931172 RepID=A0AAV6VW11_9ARAC|nr:hypothetical protein JTE90_021921 [Oedothorax gibbosus]